MPTLAPIDDHSDDCVTAPPGTLQVGNGFWSKHRGDISCTQLQKFWSVLTPQARQELLRIDKPTLFEQARKNMYCSRCNGLLLEGFVQVVMYGKSMQQDGVVSHHVCDRSLKIQSEDDFCSDDVCECGDLQDPSIHPWGGLTTTREGLLTLLDCYLNSKSLKGLQNVFDSARAREREREMLYPDACGGGGRGWISQGMVGYGRGHGTRETCALHTARLSVDTLVDFWSALGEETRLSLLRMKEEDFIERLMYRFDSKRFCRDCRRNVIREFKELKELKRTRREPRCTTWFCVADSAFQYEVTHDTVKVDFHQTFVDTFGSYSHFEWAVGTGEGKSDISDFKVVAKREGTVQARGLDLSGLNSCYITLRASRVADGRRTELCVKAHALKGQQCVHCRLVVGDGFVTITRGESIRSFFEHAEEAEEEEDDDSMDKDGNDLDGECSRPQKHAKSPELAREFLLDAAAVIFKEQVEKAFREGTARQNAHSIFVCLALKLLEDRLHVACKEIITLEKQEKLLEEEEKEKREEEERKERRRMKEREKKLRRKERLREKEKDREKKFPGSNENSAVPEISELESATVVDEESNATCDVDLVSETGDIFPSGSISPDIQDDQLLDEFAASDEQSQYDAEVTINSDDHSKYSRQKPRYRKEYPQAAYSKWSERRRQSDNGSIGSRYEPRHHHGDISEGGRRNTQSKSNARNAGHNKYGERFPCPSNRVHDRYDPHSCSCNQYNDYRPKGEQQHVPRVVNNNKPVFKSESASDMSKAHHREFVRENSGRSKGKPVNGNSPYHRESPVTKKVWEPMDTQKKYIRSNSDSDVTLRGSTSKGGAPDSVEVSDGIITAQVNNEDKDSCGVKKSEPKTDEKEGESMSSFSNSDNCSSCLSEGDSNTSLKSQNTESSMSSDSEDASQNSEGRETSPCHQNGLSECQEAGITTKGETREKEEPVKSQADTNVVGTNNPVTLPSMVAPNNDNGRVNPCMNNPQPQVLHPQIHNQNIQYPVFQSSPVGYYHQAPVPWAPPPPSNGFMPIPNHNQYVYANPYGYGLNSNPHFMPYGTLQHPAAAAALLNRNHVPVFQSLSRANDVNKLPKPGPLKEVPVPNVVPASVQQKDTPVPAESQKVPKPDKFEPVNAGFSLFHFGGPVDLSTGVKSEPPVLSGDHDEGDQNSDKKSSIEEYNLFAASNGIKFSIF